MPFAGELTSDQLDDLRDDIYWATINVAYCPNTVVFRALTNQLIAQGTFAQFAYDTVTIGAYTDVKVNQVIFISSSTSLRRPIWVGRVRELSTASVLYINEIAIVLQENLYVTVIDDRRLAEKLGRVAPNGEVLIDWNVSYAPPAPLIYNLQSGYVNPVPTGSASFDFAPLANAIADGATITGWLWDVEDGTITGGGVVTDQNITVSFPQGFRWVRLTVTSSNGQTNFLDFPVWVGTQYVIQNLIMPQIQSDMENGFTATIQGYHTEQTTVLRNLLDKTLICLYSTEYLSPTIVTNIDMIGRFVNEDGSDRGDEQVSEVQEVNFEVQGIGAQLASLSVSPFRLEDSTAPAVWGQVVKPTPTRILAHMAARLSTLSNIASVQFNPDNDVYIDKSLQNEETSSGAGMSRMAGYINAKLNYAPSGEVRVEREAFYTPDEVLDTVVDFDWLLGDLIEFNLKLEYQETSGQVIVAGSRYTRSTGKVDYFTASAPPTAQGEGEFVKKLDGLMIPEGLDNDAADTYLGEIAGVFLALSQPLVKMKVKYFDSWRNVLIPNCFQWYTFNLPANSNPRGLVFTSSQRWMLLSISRDVDTETGRNVTVGEFVLEPSSGNAQIIAALVPDVVIPALPSIPVIDAYSAFPPNPNISYPNDNPDDLDLQPINSSSGNQGYSPLPQDAAQDAANKAGKPGCQTYSIFFSNSGNVTGFTLTNTADYTVTVKGSAKIGDAVWEYEVDPSNPPPGIHMFYGIPSGDHWSAELNGGTFNGVAFYIDFGVNASITGFSLSMRNGSGIEGSVVGNRFYTYTDGAGGGGSIVAGGNLPIQNADWTVNDNFAAVTARSLNMVYDFETCSFDLYGLKIRGTGTNPFTGTPGGIDYGDAFYHAFNPEAGGLAQAYVSGGLFLQNAPIATIPPYNPQHVYTFPFVGDGNPLLMRFADSDYSDNQNVPMALEICGPGAGNYRR